MYNLRKKDIGPASIALASAFEDYPVFTYIMPDGEERKLKLKRLFGFLLGLGLLGGEVIAPSPALEGISIWYSSRARGTTLGDALRSGILGLKLALSRDAFGRFMNVKNTKTSVRRKILEGKDCCLLDVLGVPAAHQRKGIGSGLLKQKLRAIDRLGSFGYLETSDPKNTGYYEKYGFSVLHEYAINELKVFCMIRESSRTPGEGGAIIS